MVAMNLPGAQVAAVASKLRQKNKIGDYPDYGLAARFDVTVDGLTLGEWLSCDGLGIAFNPEELKAGGHYDEPIFAPARLSWTEVTLARALQNASHAQIDEFLRKYTDKWVKWDGSNTPYRGPTVVIKLLDKTGTKPIAEWELRDALIKSWSGPTLNGTKNEVATEKLVFVHKGFWPRPLPSPPLKLEEKKTNKRVQFDYFPEKYNISQGIQTEDNSGVQLMQTESHVTNVNERKIILNKLRVIGRENLQKAVNTLFDWLVPEKVEGAPAQRPANADGRVPAPKGQAPKLTLSLGVADDLQEVEVSLREVKVDFVRFHTNGSPICADIDLTLVQIPQRHPLLNPTSGGRTANRAHLVGAGDNLQRIAQDTYDDPRAWRMIAATNDIDDPLRVRVGNTLLLPGALA